MIQQDYSAAAKLPVSRRKHLLYRGKLKMRVVFDLCGCEEMESKCFLLSQLKGWTTTCRAFMRLQLRRDWQGLRGLKGQGWWCVSHFMETTLAMKDLAERQSLK